MTNFNHNSLGSSLSPEGSADLYFEIGGADAVRAAFMAEEAIESTFGQPIKPQNNGPILEGLQSSDLEESFYA